MATQRMPPAAGTARRSFNASRSSRRCRNPVAESERTTSFSCSRSCRSSFWAAARPAATQGRRHAPEGQHQFDGQGGSVGQNGIHLEGVIVPAPLAGRPRAPLQRRMRRLIEQIHDRLSDQALIEAEQLEP